MIDEVVFTDRFRVLCERFGKSFSDLTIQMFYEALEEKLTTEEFVSASKKLFAGKFFPDLQEFFDLVERDRAVKAPYVPPAAQLPAAEIKAYPQMTPEEQAVYRAQIERIRPKRSPVASTSGLTPIGEAIPLGLAGILGQVVEKRQWLSDPVLRMEAIEWAVGQEGVELVTDDEGFITDLNFVEQPAEVLV